MNSTVNVTSVLSKSHDRDNLKSEFASVFEEKILCIPDYSVSLKLCGNANYEGAYNSLRLTEHVPKELGTF